MKLIDLLAYPRPLRAAIARTIIRRFRWFSYPDRLRIGAVDRPHYGHGIFEAAKLATRLGYPRVSVIELGCGGGNGLLNAESHIAEVSKIFPVQIELYGFDTGSGMPEARDYRDLPHYFKAGQYHMDPASLQQKLRIGKLVLGDIASTALSFYEKFQPAPVGCIFCDLDFYSSTVDSFRLFDTDPRRLLPRVHMYFDDINGTPIWAASEHAGELLAIREFNETHARKKIAQNRALSLRYGGESWIEQMFIYHDFEHPDYNVYVAAEEQLGHESDIRLR